MFDPTPLGDAPPAGAPTPPSTAPRRRLVWPWVLGGILLLFFVAPTVFVGGFVVTSLLSQQADARDSARAEDAVLAFDAAYEAADCSAFEAVTSATFRDELASGDYSCEEWLQTAEDLVDGGEYGYRVRITSSSVEGDTVFVTTDESFGFDTDTAFVYVLERSGTGWVITDYFEG